MDVLKHNAERRGEATAFRFLADGESESDVVTFRRLFEESCGVARELAARGLAGERAVLLFETSPAFLAAFFGCLLAGTIAVPMSLSRQGRKDARLEGVLRDCSPAIVLTSRELADHVRDSIGEARRGQRPEVLCVDAILATPGVAGPLHGGAPAASDCAFLQYTSGSTGNPKGVMVSHGNIIANQEMIEAGFGHDSKTIFGGWLPLFHDMGLVGNVFQPIFLGIPCVLMPPKAFVQAPVKWLRMIARYRITTSGAPNFGYELCVNRIREEDLRDLDLSSWQVAFNGAERVSNHTVNRFCERFGKYGFSDAAMYPCYGLAEATLFVSGERLPERPRCLTLDREAVERGIVRELSRERIQADVKVLESVACGVPWLGGRISIADPQSGAPCDRWTVGEVRVHGPNVTTGYWNRPEETAAVFGREPDDAADGSHSGRSFRTGDLGFLDDHGRLHVTGRLKELIILNGRNLYPQDLESTARNAHPAIAGCNGAAFSVDEGGDERLVMVHEVRRDHLRRVDEAALAREVKRAISREHSVSVAKVAIVKPGTIPVTSSGKIQRRLCRSRFLAGELESL